MKIKTFLFPNAFCEIFFIEMKVFNELIFFWEYILTGVVSFWDFATAAARKSFCDVAWTSMT